MCFGGGGGDGGAAEARRKEEERQTRITAGRRTIDRTFDGGWAGSRPATAYDPNATYYTEFGDTWTPAAPIYADGQQIGGAEGEPTVYEQVLQNPADKQALDAINSGGLFTAKEQRPGFDENYYGGIRKAFTDFYLPQVDEQYDQAKRKLTYKFANTSNLDSSAGANNISNLFRDYNRERASVGDRALGAERDLRNSVEQNRSELINQLSATANPEAIATSAAARAKALATPASYSPLGDLFKVYTGTIALADQAKNVGGRGSGFKAPNPSSSQQIIW